MNLYKLEPRFHQETGKPTKPEQIQIGYICDYSGTILKFGENNLLEYNIQLNDIGGSEQIWYYDNHPVIELIKEKSNNKEIDDNFEILAKLNEDPYIFAMDDYTGQDYSTNLMKEWHDNFSKKGHLFEKIVNFHQLLRFARYRTIEKLLKKDKITLEEIGF